MTPGPAVDWSRIPVRVGDWTCPVHGVIEPARGGLVPYCPAWVGARRCMRVALHAVVRAGAMLHAEPAPALCAGPGRHRLGPRSVKLTWRGCQCTPAGGHRRWLCQDLRR